jgi:hypothetical protein
MMAPCRRRPEAPEPVPAVNVNEKGCNRRKKKRGCDDEREHFHQPEQIYAEQNQDSGNQKRQFQFLHL